MPTKTVKKTLVMIDMMNDMEAEFEPPEGLATAVTTACSVAGFTEDEPVLCVRFASDGDVRALNKHWRGKDCVTDVLSFPMQEAPFDFSESLGDMALAVPFIQHEAGRLGLSEDAHILHLIIHATLHLLGFDHSRDDAAARMQLLEIAAMRRIGLHHPYPDTILHEEQR